jgi:hypothetical protein
MTSGHVWFDFLSTTDSMTATRGASAISLRPDHGRPGVGCPLTSRSGRRTSALCQWRGRWGAVGDGTRIPRKSPGLIAAPGFNPTSRICSRSDGSEVQSCSSQAPPQRPGPDCIGRQRMDGGGNARDLPSIWTGHRRCGAARPTQGNSAYGRDSTDCRPVRGSLPLALAIWKLR